MNIRELQIGDWVSWLGKPCQVDLPLLNTEFNATEDSDNIQPILITDEILANNGFILIPYPNLSIACKWGDVDKQHIYWSDCYTVIDGYHTEREFKGYTIFVHELQQALRLCGVDKEIKL